MYSASYIYTDNKERSTLHVFILFYLYNPTFISVHESEFCKWYTAKTTQRTPMFTGVAQHNVDGWNDVEGEGRQLVGGAVQGERRADIQDVFTLHLTGKLSPPYKKV